MRVTVDVASVDVRALQRQRLLDRGGTVLLSTGEWATFRADEGRLLVGHREKQVAVDLLWTLCHLGGRRVWFRCPAESCGARVAILYIIEGKVACRRCHQLAYRSQTESEFDRVMRKVDKMRKLLGAGQLAQRPRGMHRRTFERLSGELDALVALSTVRLAESLGITTRLEPGPTVHSPPPRLP
jgi:hypothetical protein